MKPTKNATHTPGPWTSAEVMDGMYRIDQVDTDTISEETAAANARLIAAAPELLDALKMAYANIPKPTMLDQNAAERMATLAHIADLIARIEGGGE